MPATFVGLMAVGGALGISGIDVPFVELGIALSVIVLGGVVAFGVKVSLAAAMAMVGFFAIFHGHAHGAEMPADASGLAYGLGFMSATALSSTRPRPRHGHRPLRRAAWREVRAWRGRGGGCVAGVGILAGLV